jgi:hypothetical protein
VDHASTHSGRSRPASERTVLISAFLVVVICCDTWSQPHERPCTAQSDAFVPPERLLDAARPRHCQTEGHRIFKRLSGPPGPCAARAGAPRRRARSRVQRPMFEVHHARIAGRTACRRSSSPTGWLEAKARSQQDAHPEWPSAWVVPPQCHPKGAKRTSTPHCHGLGRSPLRFHRPGSPRQTGFQDNR